MYILLDLIALNGEMYWQKKLSDFMALHPTYGFAGSPVVEADLLIINACKAGIALNKLTGEVVWKSESAKTAYATPVIYSQNNTKYLALFTEKNLFGVEFDTGKIVWSLPWVTSFDANAADPLIFDNKVFISSTSGSALIDISKAAPEIVWEKDIFKSHFSSFIYFEGYIYGNDGDTYQKDGIFRCIDSLTGVEQWSKRLGLGSLILIGDKLVLLSDNGLLTIVEATPLEYHEIAKGNLPPGMYWTPPAFCRGKLYIHNFVMNEIYCLDLR